MEESCDNCVKYGNIDRCRWYEFASVSMCGAWEKESRESCVSHCSQWEKIVAIPKPEPCDDCWIRSIREHNGCKATCPAWVDAVREEGYCQAIEDLFEYGCQGVKEAGTRTKLADMLLDKKKERFDPEPKPQIVPEMKGCLNCDKQVECKDIRFNNYCQDWVLCSDLGICESCTKRDDVKCNKHRFPIGSCSKHEPELKPLVWPEGEGGRTRELLKQVKGMIDSVFDTAIEVEPIQKPKQSRVKPGMESENKGFYNAIKDLRFIANNTNDLERCLKIWDIHDQLQGRRRDLYMDRV